MSVFNTCCTIITHSNKQAALYGWILCSTSYGLITHVHDTISIPVFIHGKGSRICEYNLNLSLKLDLILDSRNI